MSQTRAKICLAASSGGHLEQALMLKDLLKKYNGFLVTEKTSYHTPSGVDKVYYLKQVNRREILAPAYIIKNAFTSLKILFKEKPDVIITTGVLAVIPLCLLGKLMGKKLIYIESFAKISSGTLSGRLCYHFADDFIIQWRELESVYPNSIYAGSIY